MNISFTPMRLDSRLEVSKTGDVLILNGEEFDFSDLPEGASLPKAAVNSVWLASDVERSAGQIRLTLILPHGPGALPETLFPASTEPDDGVIPLPPYSPATPAEETGP